jgi:hypothetical protein
MLSWGLICSACVLRSPTSVQFSIIKNAITAARKHIIKQAGIHICRIRRGIEISMLPPNITNSKTKYLSMENVHKVDAIVRSFIMQHTFPCIYNTQRKRTGIYVITRATSPYS